MRTLRRRCGYAARMRDRGGDFFTLVLALHGVTVAAVAGGLLWSAWRSRRHFAALDAALPEVVRERPPWRVTACRGPC